jgi:arginine-tRNA-protein transferase
VLDYAMMVEDSHVETRLIEYRRRGIDSAINGRGQGPILGCALTDVLADGLSMVYSFYDPQIQSRSLGTLMILDHIEHQEAVLVEDACELHSISFVFREKGNADHGIKGCWR